MSVRLQETFSVNESDGRGEKAVLVEWGFCADEQIGLGKGCSHHWAEERWWHKAALVWLKHFLLYCQILEIKIFNCNTIHMTHISLWLFPLAWNYLIDVKP